MLMSVKQFAAYSGEHYLTVRKRCISGELPAIKIGCHFRIDLGKISEMVEEQTQERRQQAQVAAVLNKRRTARVMPKRKKSAFLEALAAL